MSIYLSKTILALGLQSLVAMMLLAFRLGFSEPIAFHATFTEHEGKFLFLVWNLFLAWIPLILSQFIEANKTWTNVGLVILWLLFFPNAPYIITDIIHLRARPPVPIWYDAILLFSFAYTALIIGFVSLEQLRKTISLAISNTAGWFFSLFALILSSLGIYLGRFLRWNSWDAFLHPLEIIQSIFSISTHTESLWSVIAVVSVFTILLGAGYYSFTCMVNHFSYKPIQINRND